MIDFAGIRSAIFHRKWIKSSYKKVLSNNISDLLKAIQRWWILWKLRKCIFFNKFKFAYIYLILLKRFFFTWNCINKYLSSCKTIYPIHYHRKGRVHYPLRLFSGVFLSNDKMYASTLLGSRLSEIYPSVDLPSSLWDKMLRIS